MTTLAKTRLPETRPAKRTTAQPGTGKTRIASALAGRPVPMHKTTPLDVVLEKPVKNTGRIMPLLTGYKKPRDAEVIRAIRNGPGVKLGSVHSGTAALELLLAFRESGGDVTFRIQNRSIELGERIEPDLRLMSITMMGCSRFTDQDAWLICELGGYDESPEEMTVRINDHAWQVVNVIEHVPMPVAAALHGLLTTRGFTSVTVRHAVPRTN